MLLSYALLLIKIRQRTLSCCLIEEITFRHTVVDVMLRQDIRVERRRGDG